MALSPVIISNLTASVSSPPARPQGPGERLLVPGNSNAEENRPVSSSGRIPVGSDELTESAQQAVSALEQADKDKQRSLDYQLIKAMLVEQGREAEDKYGEETEGSKIEREVVDTEMVEVSAPVLPIQVAIEEPSQEEPVSQSDPLILDLNGNGLRTSGVHAGVSFDINGDGLVDKTSFVSGGDAFLALDKNNNGRIDNGKELFGDQEGASNGFMALSEYDENKDGQIDNSDAVYQQLRLFTIDASGAQHLQRLDEMDISVIHLNYHNTQQALNQYDYITQMAQFERSDGSTGIVGDLLLGFSQET